MDRVKNKDGKTMPEQQKQPHRMSQEEYEREKQQAEKSDDPRRRTTDYSVLDILSGEISSTATVDKIVKDTHGENYDR
jgi:hypothetical protein